jgi:aminoglycoside 2'-N-acetyltransferase I
MQIAHTSDLGGDALAAVRSLMVDAFGDQFTEDDWRHCLGGMHAGRTLMSAIDRIVRGGYELGALSATDDGVAFYGAVGWRLWEGPTYALSPDGVVRTEEDDGSVFVLPVSADLDITRELTCDWREGEVW